MGMSYPDVSLVCGSAGKQKSKGKARGEPKMQIAWPRLSAKGVVACKTSAQTPKQELQPHPSFHQSGQVLSIPFVTKSGVPPMRIMRPAIITKRV